MRDPLLDRLIRCTVRVRGSSTGSGFFVSPSLVLTCAHVVGTNTRAEVILDDSKTILPATVLGLHADPDDDLALLGVPPSCSAAALFDDGDLLLGDPITLFGYPGGIGDTRTGEYEGSSQRPPVPDRFHHLFKGAQVVSGFSGAPLLNLRTGKVIGVVTETRGKTTALGGFAIPAIYAKRLLGETLVLDGGIGAWAQAFEERKRLLSASEDDPPKATDPGEGSGGLLFRRVFAVPHFRNIHFTGRRDTLDRIWRAFMVRRNDYVCVRQTICGLGGVGKTQVAAEYAWEHRGDYPAVMWVTGRTPQDLRSSLASLCKKGMLDLPQEQAVEQAVQLEAVRDWLRSNRGWLLVIDSVDTKEAAGAVLQCLEPAMPGDVIITSRITEWPQDVMVWQIQHLTEEQAVAFLTRRLAESEDGSADDGDKRAVARALGCLPLALEQSAAYMRAHRIGFAEYLTRFQASKKELLEHPAAGATGYTETISSVWLTSYQELDREACELLELISFLAPDEIPRDFFAKAGAELRRVLAAALSMKPRKRPGTDVMLGPMAIARLPDTFFAEVAERALSQLAEYSLVNFTPTGFACHHLVAFAQQNLASTVEGRVPGWARPVIRRMNKFTRRQHVLNMLRVLGTATPKDVTDVRLWPAWEVLRPHAVAAIKAAENAGVGPMAGTLMNSVAVLLREKAEWEESEALQRRAVSLMEGLPRRLRRHALIVALSNLAVLLNDTNRIAEAEPLLRRAIAMAKASAGEFNPQIALCLTNLAAILESTNRGEEAEIAYRHALEIYEGADLAGGLQAASALNNLGSLLAGTGRLADAELLLTRALAIRESAQGPNSPAVALTLSNLAGLLNSTGRIEEAERLARRAVDITERILGANHPAVARSLVALASVLRDTSRLIEAETLYRRSIDIREASLGPEHPDVASSLLNLALCLEKLGRSTEAEPLIHRVLTIYARFARDTGWNHSYLQAALEDYLRIMIQGHQLELAAAVALVRTEVRSLGFRDGAAIAAATGPE